MRPRRRWIRRGGVWRMLRLGAVVSRERSASGRGRDGHEGGRADAVGREQPHLRVLAPSPTRSLPASPSVRVCCSSVQVVPV